MFKVPFMKELLIGAIAMNILLLMMAISFEQTDMAVLAICSGVMCALGLKLEKTDPDEQLLQGCHVQNISQEVTYESI